MNLTKLKQLIQDYCDNSETTFVADLDDIIKQAEERILRLVTIPDFRKNVSGNVLAANRFLDMPNDLLSVLSFSVTSDSTKSFMLQKDVNFLDEAFPASETGVPRFYGLFSDESFVLAPVPSSSFSSELHYRAKPESITAASSGQTWLGDNAENALFYGSVIEAYTFMKGEADLLQLYEGRFQESIERLRNLGSGLDARDDYRNGKLRMTAS